MTDHRTVQQVIRFLGLITLVLVGGMVALAFRGHELPEGMFTLAGAGLGSLGAMLASTRGSAEGGGGSVSMSVEANTDPPPGG